MGNGVGCFHKSSICLSDRLLGHQKQHIPSQRRRVYMHYGYPFTLVFLDRQAYRVTNQAYTVERCQNKLDFLALYPAPS